MEAMEAMSLWHHGDAMEAEAALRGPQLRSGVSRLPL